MAQAHKSVQQVWAWAITCQRSADLVVCAILVVCKDVTINYSIVDCPGHDAPPTSEHLAAALQGFELLWLLGTMIFTKNSVTSGLRE